MKRLVIFLLFTNLYNVIYCQEISREIKWDITLGFGTDWMYFRMKKNPLLPFEESHDEYGAWKRPSRALKLESFISGDYLPDVKISHWGTPDYDGSTRYVNMEMPHLFLVEKGDGLLGLKKNYFTGEILDSMHVNVYDSIFPYDNRFLVADDGWNHYTFHSGNVMWGDWKDVRFKRRVDMVGFVRGVQFGVDRVMYYNWKFSELIRQYRPEFPDYEYTEAFKSILTKHRLLIAAPKGKEDQLVEFIYFSNDSAKTGDPDTNNYYEMRYILPSNIESIRERRLEKRKYSDEERKQLLDKNNPLRWFIENYREEREPDIIIER